jgi:hypothetical protein
LEPGGTSAEADPPSLRGGFATRPRLHQRPLGGSVRSCVDPDDVRLEFPVEATPRAATRHGRLHAGAVARQGKLAEILRGGVTQTDGRSPVAWRPLDLISECLPAGGPTNWCTKLTPSSSSPRQRGPQIAARALDAFGPLEDYEAGRPQILREASRKSFEVAMARRVTVG